MPDRKRKRETFINVIVAALVGALAALGVSLDVPQTAIDALIGGQSDSEVSSEVDPGSSEAE
jgi:hypothetical protein